MRRADDLRALVQAASAYYRPAGPFAWRFARGKLKADPAFRAILEHGLLAQRVRILDLGAGQGLLAAWLLAARAHYAGGQRGSWPAHWQAPPQLDSYVGVEINAEEVRRARRAFAIDPGAVLEIVHGDIRDVDYGSPDAVVILDVLHYVDYASQERLLGRVRTALAPGGVLVMRVGDAAGGLGFKLSKALDRTVVLARRGHWRALHCRTLPAWQELLARVGFRARAVAAPGGGPFTNVLLRAEPA